MLEVFNKIIDIEDKARRIIESAEKEEKEIKENIDKEIKNLENEIIFKQRKKLKELELLELGEASDLSQKLLLDNHEKIKELKNKEEVNKEQWVEMVYHHIRGELDGFEDISI